MRVDKNMNRFDTEYLNNRPIKVVLLFWLFFIVGGQPGVAAEDKVAAYDRQVAALQQSLEKLEARASRDQKNSRRAERDFNKLKKDLRALRATARAELRAAEKTLGKVRQRSNQIQRDIDLFADRILEIERDTRRAQARMQAQNLIVQEMNRAQHNKLLERNESKVIAYQVEMSKVESDGNRVKKELESAEFKLLRARSKTQSLQVDDHPELIVLRRKMESAKATLAKSRAKADEANNKLRVAIANKPVNEGGVGKTLIVSENNNASVKKTKSKSPLPKASQTKPKPAAVSKPVKPKPVPEERPPAYVFVISGSGEPIEKSLALKEWVESYGAIYVQGRWDNLYPKKTVKGKAGTKLFLSQMTSKLKKIPKQSNVILIGHGQGGGAAIAAATQVASKMNRRIDYLIALDPMGEGNLRANIVYQVGGNGCTAPDGETASNKAYLKCLADSSKRVITANVKNFYNRWQKETSGLGDLARIIEVDDEAGEAVLMRSSTGKFSIATSATKTDQKRVYFGGSPDAHQALLEEVSQTLPNLLVRYIN